MSTITDLGKVKLIPRGDWGSGVTNYEYLDMVTYLGASYAVRLTTGYVPVGTLPTDAGYWQLLAAKGAQGVQGENAVRGIATSTGAPTGTRFEGETWVVFPGQYGATFTNWGNIQVPGKVGSQYVSNARFVWTSGAWVFYRELIDAPTNGTNGIDGPQIYEATGTVLPIPSVPRGTAYVGAGTFTYTGGSVTTTEKFNRLDWNGTSWLIKNAVVVTADSAYKTLDSEEYVYAITDAAKKLLVGIRKDGSTRVLKWVSGSIPKTALASLNITEADLSIDLTAKLSLTVLSPDTGYIYGIVDAQKRILFGIKTDGSVTLKNTDLETIKAQLATIVPSKAVVCTGDSLTAGVPAGGDPYPTVLQALLTAAFPNSKYEVFNRGIGGETVCSIAARHGGVPAILSADVTLPADNTTTVEIANYTTRLKNSPYAANVDWLVQGDKINPITIGGVECTMSITNVVNYQPTSNTKWLIRRNVAAAASTPLYAGEPIIPVDAKTLVNPYLSILFEGQNVGYSTDAELIAYLRKQLDFAKPSRFLIIGLHSFTAATRANLEKAMRDEFGLNYINTRQYMSSARAMSDAGITPTTADLSDMANGKVPPSLLSDLTHFNAAGFTLLANLIFNRGKQLNIFK